MNAEFAQFEVTGHYVLPERGGSLLAAFEAEISD